MIITVEHVRLAREEHGGYCVPGMERWFSQNGLSLREFLKNGYPVEIIENVGDEFSRRVVAVARERGT